MYLNEQTIFLNHCLPVDSDNKYKIEDRNVSRFQFLADHFKQ